MNRSTLIAIVCVLAMIPAACATKGSVKKEIDRIDQQMTSISSSVETNETRVKEQDSHLATHDQQISELSRESREALERAQAAQKLAEGKLLFVVTLTDDSVKFDFDKAQIKPDNKEVLDNLISTLKSEDKNVYIEIQGHTDAVGPEEYNYKLGMERAESVRRYLSEAGIPLHRISVISYGEERPVADNHNKTRRSQNRRVVIQVLA